MKLDWILLDINNFNFLFFKINYFYIVPVINYFFFNIVNFNKSEFFISIFNSYFFLELPFNYSFVYSIKFFISILFLVFIRAGLPRYRYDYLTKLGWNKFLIFSLSILIFFFLIFIFI